MCGNIKEVWHRVGVLWLVGIMCLVESQNTGDSQLAWVRLELDSGVMRDENSAKWSQSSVRVELDCWFQGLSEETCFRVSELGISGRG